MSTQHHISKKVRWFSFKTTSAFLVISHDQTFGAAELEVLLWKPMLLTMRKGTYLLRRGAWLVYFR
jgi:hypothetical protein